MQDSAASPTISVALCTHNGAAFVVEQVRSILEQSLPAHQLVISDDASTDGTVELALAEVARHDRAVALEVVVLRNDPALGVVKNFEQAVRACTGELVALSDQDDRWMPDRLERAAREFAARPALALLFADARLVDGAGVPLGPTLFEAIEFAGAEQAEVREGRALDVLLRRNVVTGATAMFRRALAEVALPFPASWVHDEWLAIVAAITGEVDFLLTPVIDYRQHGGNQIGARKPTLGDRLGRLREPRTERNRRLRERAEALAQRVEGWPAASAAVRELARGKLEHERARSALPAARLLRLAPVLRAARAGGYARFGRARYDIVRDLTQSPR